MFKTLFLALCLILAGQGVVASEAQEAVFKKPGLKLQSESKARSGSYMLRNVGTKKYLQYQRSGQQLFPSSKGSYLRFKQKGKFVVISPADSNDKCGSAQWNYTPGLGNWAMALYACKVTHFKRALGWDEDALIDHSIDSYLGERGEELSEELFKRDTVPDDDDDDDEDDETATAPSLAPSLTPASSSAPASAIASPSTAANATTTAALDKRDPPLRLAKQYWLLHPAGNNSWHIIAYDHLYDMAPRAVHSCFRRSTTDNKSKYVCLKELNRRDYNQRWKLIRNGKVVKRDQVMREVFGKRDLGRWR